MSGVWEGLCSAGPSDARSQHPRVRFFFGLDWACPLLSGSWRPENHFTSENNQSLTVITGLSGPTICCLASARTPAGLGAAQNKWDSSCPHDRLHSQIAFFPFVLKVLVNILWASSALPVHSGYPRPERRSLGTVGWSTSAMDATSFSRHPHCRLDSPRVTVRVCCYQFSHSLF